MSIRTAPLHTAAELTFVAADHVTGIVEFSAPSKHDATRVNIVSLDTTNGAILCTCKGFECGRACWHADHVLAAWLASPAMQQVKWLTDEGLVRHGKKARTMVTIYAARIGRTLPADALSLVAATCEWRRRVAAARALAGRFQVGTDSAPELDAPTSATHELIAAARQTVAEWETLSYSDRHIDRHVDGGRGEREYLAARAALAGASDADGQDILIAIAATPLLARIHQHALVTSPQPPTNSATLAA
jgi:hypothetical protein